MVLIQKMPGDDGSGDSSPSGCIDLQFRLFGFYTGTHQSLLSGREILTEIIGEQNEEYNRASSGTGECTFKVLSYQVSTTQRNHGGGAIKGWSQRARTK